MHTPDPSQKGFTLIELLVVITIIVVLLSLLAPAMDKAVYQAEMVVDGANQHGVASGTLAYAMEHRRYYPDRRIATMASWLAAGTSWDHRPMLEPYMGYGLLVDPFSGDLDIDPGSTDADSQVFSSYALWFGRQIAVNGVVESSFLRVGDRARWDGDKFNVLVSDRSRLYRDVYSLDNHPDDAGVTSNVVLQNENHSYAVPGVPGDKWVLARWEVSGTHRRGLLNMIFTFDDGSSRRFDGIDLNDPLVPETQNEGFGTIPNYPDGTNVGVEWMILPTVGK